MMTWIYVVLAVAAVVGAFMEFYVRFLPAWKENRARKVEAAKTIKERIRRSISNAENYKQINLQGIGEPVGSIKKLEDLARDAGIRKELHAGLIDLEKLAEEYERWRTECYLIINTEVKAQNKPYLLLEEAFTNVFHSGLESFFSGYEGSRSEKIYKELYRGTLTFEIAKEHVLTNNWNMRVQVKEATGSTKELNFRDIIEGQDFHLFIEGLQKLQEREPLKTLRIIQANFLEKASAISGGL